ncbi:MAG: hypothetical protein RSD40_04825 [Bacilli bacterium]
MNESSMIQYVGKEAIIRNKITKKTIFLNESACIILKNCLGKTLEGCFEQIEMLYQIDENEKRQINSIIKMLVEELVIEE